MVLEEEKMKAARMRLGVEVVVVVVTPPI